MSPIVSVGHPFTGQTTVLAAQRTKSTENLDHRTFRIVL